jgi:hypothetical protein
MISVHSPVPEASGSRGRLSARPSSLTEAIIGIRREWPNFELFGDLLARHLCAEGIVRRVKKWDINSEYFTDGASAIGRATEEELARRSRRFDEFASGIDAAVVGIGA